MAQDILTLPPIEVATMPNAPGDSYQQAIHIGDEFWVVGANGTSTKVWRGSGTTWEQIGGIEGSGSSQFAQSGMLATDGTINGIFLAHIIRMANGEPLPSSDGCPPFTNLGAGVRIYHYDPVDNVFKRINRAIQPPFPAPPIDDSLMGLTHGAEGAHALVAEVERDLCDGGATAQSAHRLQHSGLLPPCAEAQARLALEAAGEGARAGVDGLGPCLERALIAGRIEQRLAERPQARIARHRQLQAQRLQALQLRHARRSGTNYIATLPALRLPKDADSASATPWC